MNPNSIRKQSAWALKYRVRCKQTGKVSSVFKSRLPGANRWRITDGSGFAEAYSSRRAFELAHHAAVAPRILVDAL